MCNAVNNRKGMIPCRIYVEKLPSSPEREAASEKNLPRKRTKEGCSFFWRTSAAMRRKIQPVK